MKILQISSGKNFGNYERNFVELCKGLQNRGHEVFAVVRPTCNWKERLDFLPKQNIFRISIRNSFGIFSAQQIAKIVRERGIEIVHAHITKDYFPISLSCRIAKTPKFVLTRHSSYPMKTFHRFALTNLGKAIAVSEKIKANLQTLFPKEKVVCIPNGIESNSISAAERKKAGEAFRLQNNIPLDSVLIGTIGELRERNGQRDLVLAANIVGERFHDAHFAVIGEENSMNKSFRRELRRMVKVFGLEKRFLWLDFVEDTTAFLNALDVFVSPKHSSNPDVTILQAMANQTAVVATENAYLQNDETGLIVPGKKPVQLAEAINRLLSDEDLRNEFGKKAQEAVQEKFDAGKMIEETEKVYRQIAEVRV